MFYASPRPIQERHPMNLRLSFSLVAAAGLLAAATPGCASKEYVRGADDPSIDRPAMSTGLDKDDIERSLQTLLNQMRAAPIMTEWRMRARQNDRQIVAIAPFLN